MLAIKVKYRPENRPDNLVMDGNQAQSEATEDLVDLNYLNQVQQRYMKTMVDGRIKISLPLAKSLVTSDGSIKTKIFPRVKVFVPGIKPIQSQEFEGRSPEFNFKTDLDFSVERGSLDYFHVEVWSKDNFLGQCLVPMEKLMSSPGSWTVNSMLELTEKSENINKYEKLESVGKIYVQAQFLALGMKDTQQFLGINKLKN